MPSLSGLRRHLPHALLGIVLILGLATLRDYGVTTDEPIRASMGDNWLRFVTTLDRSYLPQGWLANFPPLADMIGAAATRAFRMLGGQDDYIGRHLTSFAFGWLGLVGTYRLGKRVLPAGAATVALALLILVPRYYGASFDNPKDIPFAAGFVWAMLGVVRLLQEPSPRNAAWCGAFAAICTAIRPFGVLFVLLGALACIWPLRPPQTEAGPRRLLAIQLSCALVLTVALWPLLWVTPPWHAVEAAIALGGPNARLVPAPHLFLGQVYGANDPPASYAAVWIAITLPLPTLLLALAGGAALIARARGGDRRGTAWTAALAGLWVIAPVLGPLLHRVPMHNAVRHFFFVMPGLCLLAALGAHRIFSAAVPGWRRALVALAVLAYGDVVVTGIRLHPYQDLYFSRLVGGLSGAAGEFDTAYYGETYRESFLWLRDHVEAPVHVTTIWRDVPDYYAARLGMAMNTPSFGYYLSEVRLDGESYLPGEVVHRVERDGVPLAVVVKVTPMEQTPEAWLGTPWTQVPVRDGRVDLVDGAAKLALSIDSPRDQTVPFYWGYQGGMRIATNPARQVQDLPAPTGPLTLCNFRTELKLRAGHNAVLVDLTGLDRSAGLFVHYPSDRELQPGPPPPGT